MAAKKTSKSTPNKSEFVRSLPSTLPLKDVVAKAKAAGITLTEKYVSTIRYNAKVSARKKGGPSTASSSAPSAASTASAAAPVKRGPGRPPKVASAAPRAASTTSHTVGGLVSEIERIVERKVTELLRAKLGSIFGH